MDVPRHGVQNLVSFLLRSFIRYHHTTIVVPYQYYVVNKNALCELGTREYCESKPEAMCVYIRAGVLDTCYPVIGYCSLIAADLHGVERR